ncbi:bifunctional 4-hydroxy-2-oxoglutarate aldolase/2-dehydro-3-deoxy-phosphogluconate aldolase [Flammeovirgaceae bacterium SG7u.111]|nr:bifunctional 4-hydroxy-2-oxoglutarate aldolase/2-dehydro-3-deoxy-phosphogluconate aldolase [Flammeovirgaceae bacterium SG7u.132]WPO38664.1 bifunctional 4-hydroxy-2-oxoglutarate aldolase/2-dehydro-3-deoxy-phosphogluconate aldolase [Flammeovirgaceae bacterium SG7u.111]
MENNESFSWEKFKKAPLVGIIRGMDFEIVRNIARSFADAGFYTLEVTMNTAGVTEMIPKLREEFPDLMIGAGTVCSMDDFNKAVGAGAQFIVTPIMDEEVIKASVAKGIPIFPGAYSPTEIYKAWSLGATAVKIFPATQLGTRYIKDVLAPLNQIKLLPTGGVNLENIKSFFEAGAVGAGMGSTLLHKELIKDGDFDGLTKFFLSFKEELRDFL